MTTNTFTTPAERLAVRLASEGVPLPDAAEELSAFSPEQLAAARDALVGRLHHLPDDYSVGLALQAVYRAIAIKGWPVAIDWREQICPSRRRHAGRDRILHLPRTRRRAPCPTATSPAGDAHPTQEPQHPALVTATTPAGQPEL